MRLLLLLLLLPTAAASLTWDAPTTAAEGHPVMARLHAPAGEAVEVEVWMDGFRLVGTRSVMEADGVGVFVATPPDAGRLRFVARMEDTSSEAAVDVSPARFVAMDPVLAVTDRRIEVRDAWSLVTLRDDEGRASLTVWDDGQDASALEVPLGARMVRAIATTHPEDPFARGARWLDSDAAGATANTAVPGAPGHPACTDVTMDPASSVPGGWAWQAGTTVRVSHDGAATYRLLSAPLTTGILEVPTQDFHVTSPDAYGQVSFRPGVGQGWLIVDDDTTCQVAFMGLPEPPTRGVLLLGNQDNPWGTRIDMVAVAGAPLPSYDFDVRIIRLEDEGALAWAGVLHATHDEANIHISFLPPGDYVAEVYPSPRDAETPSVTTSDPAGHVLYFTLPAATADDVEAQTHPAWMGPPVTFPDDRQDTPWPGTLLVAVLLLLARYRS